MNLLENGHWLAVIGKTLVTTDTGPVIFQHLNIATISIYEQTKMWLRVLAKSIPDEVSRIHLPSSLFTEVFYGNILLKFFALEVEIQRTDS